MKERVVTATLLILIVVGLVCLNSIWSVALLSGLCGYLVTREALRLSGKPPSRSLALLVGTSMLTICFLVSLWNYYWIAAATLLFAVTINFFALLLQVMRGRLKLLNLIAWGALPFIALPLAHAYSPTWGTGLWWSPMLIILVPTWAGDTAALLVGKAIGKRPLAPLLSPKKTWEGAIAQLLASMGVCYWLSGGLGIPSETALACGVIIGTLGPAGDLFESAIKRKSGVKDTGLLLPGHGGFLDRVDSLLLSSAPCICLLLWIGQTKGLN